MSTISIRLPDDLKAKAMRLAKKHHLSFNSPVHHWLQAAVMQDETLEWMQRRLREQKPEALIAAFGTLLEQTTSGNEPSLDEMQQALRQ